MSGTIDEVLWTIFTFYSLNGNPKDPSRLNKTGLLKLCKDVMALDSMMTEKPLIQADLELIYTSEIRNPKKIRRGQIAEKSDKLDFDEFLSCLVRIAKKCYPSSKTKEEATQQFLMDNVLPLASRRNPTSIATILKQPVIEGLFKYYEDALKQLFNFFATSSQQLTKGKNMVLSTRERTKTFDEQVNLIEEAKVRSHIQTSHANMLAYKDFLRFANDFGLSSSLGLLTHMDLGDVYLTVISFNNFTPALRKIDFKEFWEVVVRCALAAFKDKPMVTVENKVKGLFLHLWRTIQSSSRDQMANYGTLEGGGFNSYKGGLLKGSQTLNERFVAAWTKDDYRDYIEEVLNGENSPKPTVSSPTSRSIIFNQSMNRTEDLTLLGASGKKRLKFGNSLMSKLLGSSTNSEATANTLTKSPEKSTQLQNFLRDSQRSPNGNQEKKFLHNLIHDSVDKSDNFAVNSNGRVISVMISDSDYLGDDRIRPSDLRKLLYRRPEIAGILYDCLVEEGIVKDIQAPTSIETKDYMYEASETDSHDDNDHTEELNRNDDNSVFGVDHHSRDQESSDKGDFEDEPLTTEALVG